MLIESELLIGQFSERCVAGGKALSHRVLGCLAFGDVARDLGEPLVGTLVVVHGSDHDVGPESGTVLADSLCLFLEAPLGEGFLQFAGGLIGCAILGNVKTRKMLAYNFLISIALDASRTRIPTNHVALGVEHIDGIVLDPIVQQPKPFLTFVQPFFSQLAFRDIRTDPDVLPRFSIPSGEWDDGRIDPVNRTILSAVLNLAVPNLS